MFLLSAVTASSAVTSLFPLAALLRYLRTDRRMSSVTLNNLVLADGQKHRLLFHLKGLQQQGPIGVELHLDCRLVETIRDLPAAFQGLPAGYATVELKTMPLRDQVTPPSHGVPVNVHIRCLTVNVQSTANLLFFFFF